MTTAMPLTLEIRLHSDWHVGQGAGQQGHIDSLVRRDLDELPYLPAKTLTGVWRDGCEAIARGLDRGSAGGWCRLVEALFGEEVERRQTSGSGTRLHEARLSVRPARLPDSLRAHLRASQALRDALTFIKAGVAIDPATGRARDRQLRFEEVVRSGALLTAEVSLDASDLDDNAVRALGALLWAGARAVDHIGGKRRRGLGRCTLGIEGLAADTAAALRILKDGAPEIARPRRQPQPIKVSAAIPDAATEWLTVPLTLQLRTPVVIPSRTLGNLVAGLDYIPGTHLLGHVSRTLAPLLGTRLAAAVACGDLRVSHANIEVGTSRGLPVPLSFHYAKDRGGLERGEGVWNLLAESDPADAAQRRQQRAGYIAGSGDRLPAFRTAPLQQTTHNTIDDSVQRPTSAVGGVFTYEALRAGTVLHAALHLRRSLAEGLPSGWWRGLSRGDLRLGIAKKDDYGLVAIQAGEPGDRRPPATAPHAGGQLVVWLLSDLLLRDARLAAAATPALLTELLAERLALPLAAPRKAFLRTRRSEGWHTGWGMPRPSYAGLMAGSCLAFDLPPHPPADLGERLRRLELEGLGERRAEGFGEVAVNHALAVAPLSRYTPAPPRDEGPPPPDSPPPPIEVEHPDWGYASAIERAAWRAELRRRCFGLASDQQWRLTTLHWCSGRPGNSQLGALRAVLMAAGSAEELTNGVATWVGSVKATSNRSDKWPEKALGVLARATADDALVWRWLDEGKPALPVMTATGAARLQRELWLETVRGLLLAAIRAEQRAAEGTSTPTPGRAAR